MKTSIKRSGMNQQSTNPSAKIPQQLSLLNKQELRFTKAWSFGGQKLTKRRKTKRPLLANKSIHVVFKCKNATGNNSLIANIALVNTLLSERAKKYFVNIQEKVNMGNHLHLKVTCKDTKRLQNFLRTFAAILARKITGAHRGKPVGRFWDGLVFTRVLHSSFEDLGLRGYFEANHREREFGKAARQEYLANFQQFLSRLKKVRSMSRTQAEFYMQFG